MANGVAKKVTSPPPFLQNGGGQPQVRLRLLSLLSVLKSARSHRAQRLHWPARGTRNKTV